MIRGVNTAQSGWRRQLAAGWRGNLLVRRRLCVAVQAAREPPPRPAALRRRGVDPRPPALEVLRRGEEIERAGRKHVDVAVGHVGVGTMIEADIILNLIEYSP